MLQGALEKLPPNKSIFVPDDLTYYRLVSSLLVWAGVNHCKNEDEATVDIIGRIWISLIWCRAVIIGTAISSCL